MISTNEFAAIAALDFEAIKVKLMTKKGGSAWSTERTDAVEIEYRRFLYLMKMFPNVPAAPTIDVDTFWHQHILDTMKYATDCDRIFGYFLHHFPYLGMRGKEDEKALVRLAGRMGELYEATFGESYPGATPEGTRPRTALSAGVHIRKLAAASMDTRSAWCIEVNEPMAQAALNTQPAWCIKVNEPMAQAAMNTQPAWCIEVNEPMAQAAMNTQPAWCIEVNEPMAQASMNTDPGSQARDWRSSIAPEFSPSFYTQRPRLATA